MWVQLELSVELWFGLYWVLLGACVFFFSSESRAELENTRRWNRTTIDCGNHPAASRVEPLERASAELLATIRAALPLLWHLFRVRCLRRLNVFRVIRALIRQPHSDARCALRGSGACCRREEEGEEQFDHAEVHGPLPTLMRQSSFY